MHINYKYKKSKLKVQKSYILKNLDIRSKILRPVQLLNFLRKKLELQQYGRPHFEALELKKCFLIFLITFINVFKAYKNIYRSFMGIYNIPANLPALKRLKKIL